ncbi:MAG: hypothetical protein LUD83_02480, partial [Clostridiales bacterium]|nr:hypothetical protein [Clostridiales bacterium]
KPRSGEAAAPQRPAAQSAGEQAPRQQTPPKKKRTQPVKKAAPVPEGQPTPQEGQAAKRHRPRHHHSRSGAGTPPKQEQGEE